MSFSVGDRVFERHQNQDRVGTVTHVVLKPDPRTSAVARTLLRVVFPSGPDEWVDAAIMERAP